MTIDEVISGLPAVYLTPKPAPASLAAKSVSGGYACDMLSLVISGVQPDEAWFTILNSLNVVAVAVLAECPLVVLTQGVAMEPSVISRAAAQNVIIAATGLTTYEACVRLNALLTGTGTCAPEA